MSGDPTKWIYVHKISHLLQGIHGIPNHKILIPFSIIVTSYFLYFHIKWSINEDKIVHKHRHNFNFIA